jgi:hypothetical protein
VDGTGSVPRATAGFSKRISGLSLRIMLPECGRLVSFLIIRKK